MNCGNIIKQPESKPQRSNSLAERTFIFIPLAFVVLTLFSIYFLLSILITTDLMSKISIGMQGSDIEARLGKPKEIFYKHHYEQAMQSVSNPYQIKGDLKLPIIYKVEIYDIHNVFLGSRLYVFYNKENIVDCKFVEDSSFRPFWYRIVKNQKSD